MQTAYLEAVVNRRHRVLGRDLHDFCFYDALFLEVAGNPIWLGGRVPTLADLQEAVNICSLPPERLLRAEPGPRNWRERIAHTLWTLGCAHLHRDPAWLDLATARFRCYVADYYTVPALWDARSGGRTLRAPWILGLASYIEAHSNMTEREIMTAPIGLMHWKAETIAERRAENLADMMTDEEEAIGAEQRAAMEAAGETFPEDDDEQEGGA